MHPSRLAALAGPLLLAACITDVSPTSRVLRPLRLADPPVLLVSANRDRERVVDALDRAGISTTEDLRRANFELEAKLGAKKSDSPCGVVRNVVFIVRERGTPALQIKGRGGTGACANNILQQMSQELERALETAASG